MSINYIQDKIVEEFAALEDWLDKYEYIIRIGKELAPLDDRLKSEQYAVKGCQSEVWISSELSGDKISFLADSDALITRVFWLSCCEFSTTRNLKMW